MLHAACLHACLGLQTCYQLFCDERLPALKADNPKVLPRALLCCRRCSASACLAPFCS